ncbi:MAG: helix-turn-helix domain-containing protein [Gaiellaceae bacterium]
MTAFGVAPPKQMTVQRDRQRAVERVIEAMTEHLDKRFSLEKFASIALFSPYHFHRVFRQVTGVPPGHFFTALRIDLAKRLLLTSDLSVTEICYAVGYLSLGTFTSQFTRLVGISPRRLRRLMHSDDWTGLATLELPHVDLGAQPAVRGRIAVGHHEPAALVAVGLFPSRLAQGRPAGCTLASAPGEYELSATRAGVFHVLAVSLGPDGHWNDLTLDECHTLVAATATPVRVHLGQPVHVDLVLRPRRVTDPPILLAPALLLQRSVAAA